MMKRFLIVLALALFLCGCTHSDPEQTDQSVPTTTAAPTVQTTEPTQPDPGLYVPDSAVER